MTSKATTKKRDDFPIVPIIGIFFILLFALSFGYNKLGEDFPVVIRWWFDLIVVGVAVFPITYTIFNKFHDGGYIAGKAIGLAIASWVSWFLSSIHAVPFTQLSTKLVLGVLAVIIYGIYIFLCKKNKKPVFEGVDTEKYTYMIYYEVLFLALFVLWCYMRSYIPKITNDTEKYMDFGFLASLINTKYMPATDMWFSGEPINYYYYGIYVGAYQAHLANVSAGYAYNLDLMTIAALSGLQVYSIAHELIFKFAKESQKEGGIVYIYANAAGFLATGAVTIAGNLQYVFYKFIIPIIKKIENQEVKGYWFPDATRFITDTNGTDTGTLIHEFPCYSYVLGDLHAHVTDIIFALLAMMILLAFLMNREERMKASREKGIYDVVSAEKLFDKESIQYYLKEACNPAILMASFLIGIIRITNSWDFPIYFVVAGAFILFSNAAITGYKRSSLILTAVHAVECLVISTLVSLPFNIYFDSMTAGIGLCKYHSSPWEIAMLWGLPLPLCISLYVINIRLYKAKAAHLNDKKTGNSKIVKKEAEEKGFVYSTVKVKNEKTKKVIAERRQVNHLFSFIYGLETSDLFVMTLAICAAGLLLMCELIYVADIYPEVFQRTNTYFKLSYQAYMMFGICMAYIIVRYVAFEKTKKTAAWGAVAGVFLIWSFFYLGQCITNYYGITKVDTEDSRTLNSYNVIYQAEKVSPTIDGKTASEYLQDSILWVKDNVDPSAVIAQMYTTSYGPFAMVSAYTGNPTVIGWAYHEWLWRNGGTLEYPEEVTERTNAIMTLYTTRDESVARAIIEKYNIEYIYVGYAEHLNGMVMATEPTDGYKYYRGKWYEPIDIDHEFLRSLGTVVYDNGTVTYADQHASTTGWKPYQTTYENYIVKVK